MLFRTQFYPNPIWLGVLSIAVNARGLRRFAKPVLQTAACSVYAFYKFSKTTFSSFLAVELFCGFPVGNHQLAG